jgi:hypothetical protein
MSENVFANSKYGRNTTDIDILEYAHNLKRATRTDLHQDLLFYQMQLDSIERKITSKLSLIDSSLKKIALRKITALNDETERRSLELLEIIE